MGISKKRGRKGGSAQAASNKFGHRKEMELFRIDNAPHQWRRGQAKRMDVFLGLIQSKVHTRMYTLHSLRKGFVHSDLFIHAYEAGCNERRKSTFGDAIKEPSIKRKEESRNKMLCLSSVRLSCFLLSSVTL